MILSLPLVLLGLLRPHWRPWLEDAQYKGDHLWLFAPPAPQHLPGKARFP